MMMQTKPGTADGLAQRPATPRQAARVRGAIDGLLDPALFRALADPTRARLLACLVKCGRACSVSEVAECCAVDFSVVARHLATLARAGVVRGEKRGRTVWYSLCAEATAQRLRGLAAAIEAGACGGAGACGEEGSGCC